MAVERLITKAFSFQGFGLWPQRRGARIESIDAEADALVRDFGDAAHSEACRRERKASSEAIAKDWALVGLAIARRLTADAGPGPSASMAARVALIPDRGPEPPVSSQAAAVPHFDDRREAAPEETLHWFKIQYVGARAETTPSILKEVDVQVPDVSAAIVEAANLVWPQGTIALRILDQAGREVFERHRPERR
jgi:hypothetical protein